MQDGGFPAKSALDPVAQNLAWVPTFLFDLLGLPSNRDGCRTPMQWDGGPNAGFCSAEVAPWLLVHKNRGTANVADQSGDQDSLLNLYRALLRLRRDTPVLQTGELTLIDNPAIGKNILAYTRSSADQTIFVALNFGGETEIFQNPTDCRKILIFSGMELPADPSRVSLPPYTGIVLRN
jgi:glycosidase